MLLSLQRVYLVHSEQTGLPTILASTGCLNGQAMCGIAVSKQKVTWICMQSLGTCLSLANYILKIQLGIPIDHRVDSHKLQHRLFGVRSCTEDCCSESCMSFAASQTCTHMPNLAPGRLSLAIIETSCRDDTHSHRERSLMDQCSSHAEL